MNQSVRIDIDDLCQRLLTCPTDRRSVIAIVGAPGAGKSTVAETLYRHLEAQSPGRAAVLPMDGYHYDDILLDALGLRARKGSPDTFDVDGLRHMLLRLRDNRDKRVCVPVFDRDLEIARAGARFIDNTVSVLLVEGNYLLLDEPPWSSLADCFDLTVMIDVPREILRQRLIERWEAYGLPPDDIAFKVEGNDLPNGDRVITRSRPADLVLVQT